MHLASTHCFFFAVVSEFFMIAPATLTTESFFAMPKSQQADMIWDHLFRQRLPISEAQIGIVTTLQALGLSKEVEAKDLNAIRKWFAEQVLRRGQNKLYIPAAASMFQEKYT